MFMFDGTKRTLVGGLEAVQVESGEVGDLLLGNGGLVGALL